MEEENQKDQRKDRTRVNLGQCWKSNVTSRPVRGAALCYFDFHITFRFLFCSNFVMRVKPSMGAGNTGLGQPLPESVWIPAYSQTIKESTGPGITSQNNVLYQRDTGLAAQTSISVVFQRWYVWHVFKTLNLFLSRCLKKGASSVLLQLNLIQLQQKVDLMLLETNVVNIWIVFRPNWSNEVKNSSPSMFWTFFFPFKAVIHWRRHPETIWMYYITGMQACAFMNKHTAESDTFCAFFFLSFFLNFHHACVLM